MQYFFVHAPNKDGWNGELLLEKHKENGSIRHKDIEKIIMRLYPDDNHDSFHYDNDVSPNRIEDYLCRKERGVMQRRSSSGSYEDLHYDEWLRGIAKHYPHLTDLISFVIPQILGVKD